MFEGFGGVGKFFQKWGRRCKPRRRRLVVFVAEERSLEKGFSIADRVVNGFVIGFLCGVLKCEGSVIGVVSGVCVGRLSSVSRRFCVFV